MTRPHPDLWYPIAELLAALRTLLRATAPTAFAQIALDARAHLAALTALVRRYLHVLAADISLPSLRPLPPLQDEPEQREGARSSRYLFPLIEHPARRARASLGEDPPELQHALLMEAVQRLVSVMANPAPHALRLARFLRRFTGRVLRELPVRWSILRRVGPGVDTLLMRLDAAARPQAGEGIDSG